MSTLSDKPFARKASAAPGCRARPGSVAAFLRRHWPDALVHTLLPPGCLLCGQGGLHGYCPLCPGCRGELPRTDETPGAALLPAPLPAFIRLVWTPFWYDDPVDELVRAAKFGRQIATARALGRLLVEEGVPWPEVPGVLVPVPLHWRRHGRRGFNQAREIADGAAALLGWPVVPDACRRVRETAEQSALGAGARLANLRGAFVAGPGVRRFNPDHRWILLDDVLTTGATATAVALALHTAGISRLEFWAVARTPAGQAGAAGRDLKV